MIKFTLSLKKKIKTILCREHSAPLSSTGYKQEQDLSPCQEVGGIWARVTMAVTHTFSWFPCPSWGCPSPHLTQVFLHRSELYCFSVFYALVEGNGCLSCSLFPPRPKPAPFIFQTFLQLSCCASTLVKFAVCSQTEISLFTARGEKKC